MENYRKSYKIKNIKSVYWVGLKASFWQLALGHVRPKICAHGSAREVQLIWLVLDEGRIWFFFMRGVEGVG
jgi:hypothetical protein